MAASVPEPAHGAGTPVPPAVAARFAELGYGPAAQADFARWRGLLETWSRRINLVAPGELSQFWERHALDSAQLFPLGPKGGRWIDLGAGAGFPGIAIAIGLKHAEGGAGGEVLLVESVGKKAGFLREAVRLLDLPARVAHSRWEALPAEPFDVVTARAFAPLPRLLDAARRFWGPGTLGVFPKGKSLDDEIAAAEREFRFRAERVRSITGDGAILRVTGLGVAELGAARVPRGDAGAANGPAGTIPT